MAYSPSLFQRRALVWESLARLASNIGPDSTQVFIGSLPYATPPLANIISGQLFPYSIEFDLKKPFHFNPAIGNLLLDVVNNSTISGFGDMDGVYNGTAFSSAVTTNNPGAPGGAPELGLTTGFNETSPDGFINYVAVPTITPLPAALPLFATGLGGLGLLGWRWKRKARAGA